jgi:hypothetical protein
MRGRVEFLLNSKNALASLLPRLWNTPALVGQHSQEGDTVTEKHHLARLQLAIMQVLWDRNEATVAEVQEALKPERNLAYTTV